MDDKSNREAASHIPVASIYDLPKYSPVLEMPEGESGSDLRVTESRLVAQADRDRNGSVRPHGQSDVPKGSLLQAETDYRKLIADTCDYLKAFLLEKNAAYGNSVFEPANIFSRLPAKEGVLIRIDDKLKRIRNGSSYLGDNDVLDATGYLIILLALLRKENGQ